ncbi:hypothetical protein [Micromonospora siamensis]|uniref:Uncharacterized protein n=1 Tax=Micromonospora siamensis TaxID=299152 RepID=A0A1C5GY96_9ACTN|nr:hypothetical protein [Micromonospora siamensis]SCG38762.1 hypothetical protein GA0074704_0725 [Micromonospora siamensis]
MAGADRGTTGAKNPVSSAKAPAWKHVLFSVVLFGVLAACILGSIFGGGDSGTDVPAPAADERADTVPLLARATADQGICYGWSLTEGWGSDPVNVGSNLGDGVAVEDNPSCPRWVQVVAEINYTSASSESSDSAVVRVTGSEDIGYAELSTVRSGLERLGLDEDAFVDDPGWAVTRAAVMLPLLAVEAGLAQPAATPSAGPVSPTPLPAAGNDFLRDRWGWLVATFGLLLLAALLLTVGVVQRRRQLREAVPAQRAGAGTAGPRTRENA